MLTLFILHDLDDDAFLLELRRHLSILERNFGAKILDRHSVEAGSEVKSRMQELMASAEVVLLLYSDHFGADDDCIEYMREALEMHRLGTNRLVPIILRESNWRYEPFAHLQVLPPNQVPLASKNWDSPNTPYVQITDAVMRLVKAKNEPPAAPLPPAPQPIPPIPAPAVPPSASPTLPDALLGKWQAVDVLTNGVSRRALEPAFVLTNEYLPNGKVQIFDGTFTETYAWQLQGHTLHVTAYWILHYTYRITELTAQTLVITTVHNGADMVLKFQRMLS
jgi:hypothetical protein